MRFGMDGGAIARSVFAAAVLFTTATFAPRARALDANERVRLALGESVITYTEHTREGVHLIGGVAYRVIPADADRLSELFRTPARWVELLPRVEAVKLMAVDENGQAHVRVSHRFGVFAGSYDLVVAFEEAGLHGRFWVDQHGVNDVDDGWGFIRFTPLPGGSTLVTWAVLFDPGEGMTRTLFGAKMQRAALDVPRLLARALLGS
jgi:hypothetical protein